MEYLRKKLRSKILICIEKRAVFLHFSDISALKMRVHYMDALILILALLGVITVTFLGFDSLSVAARDSG